MGAALGALAGGVGAVPGAALGGAWGAEAGLVILEWLGLGFLAASIGSSVGSAARQAEQAVEIAWRSVDAPATADLAVTRAAEELASAVAQVFRGVLQGIVAFLLSEGAAAAAARVPELTARLRGSRLGGRFATWVEQSWQRLITNPRLRPQEISAGPSNGGARRGAWSAAEAQPSKVAPREATPAAPSIRRIPVSGARLQATRDGALHNQEWRKIDVAEFKAMRTRGWI